MSDRVAELLVEFSQWLEHPNTMGIVQALLDTHSRVEWLTFVKHYTREQRLDITRTLLNKAHELLSRSPKDAEPLARLGIEFSKVIVLPHESEQASVIDDAVELQADAWREQAHALLTLGDYESARRSGDEATFLYNLSFNGSDGSLASLLITDAVSVQDKDRLERIAVLALIMGQTLPGLGCTDDGLLLVEQASHVLLSCCENKQKYVQGRTIYAMLLASSRHYSKAATVLKDVAGLARELNDDETLAHVTNNIGYCYYHTGKIAKARQSFEIALEGFNRLGLKAEALRPRNYLATILINDGSYNRAALELLISRAAYLDAGLPNEAAEVMLKIIRTFILANRTDRINWVEMEETFAAAGLRPEALEALLHLRAVGRERTLRLADVDAAEDILARLNAPVDTARDEAG